MSSHSIFSYNSFKLSTEKLKLANNEAHFKHTVSAVLSIYKKEKFLFCHLFWNPAITIGFARNNLFLTSFYSTLHHSDGVAFPISQDLKRTSSDNQTFLYFIFLLYNFNWYGMNVLVRTNLRAVLVWDCSFKLHE